MKKNVIERRKKALNRLEMQLESGNKNTKEGVVELTESNKKRINKEIEIIKTRI